MATIYPMGFDVPMEEKHRIVKEYYSQYYKDVKLPEKFLDRDVQLLWMKILQLEDNMREHFEKKPGLKEKFLKKNGLSNDPLPEA